VRLQRRAGILLHPTSLPSPFGIGDFGEEAFRFLRQLAEAGQTIWQMLPLGPAGYGNSPYAMFSAFAGNPLLISPEILVHNGLLSQEDLHEVPHFREDVVEYARVSEFKLALLRRAHENFVAKASPEVRHKFDQFCADHKPWLDDYALFIALKSHFGEKNWTDWDKPLVRREPAVLYEWQEKLGDEIEVRKYWQFEFFRQWQALRDEAQRLNIQIVGDLPIYVSHDSADVWAHSEQFCLDKDGRSTVVAGVPPDYFSETGQLWGNPLYRWEEMKRAGYEWWIKRFRAAFRLFDVVRLDHFRGFQAYWQVPASEKTAVNGQWMEGPGAALFKEVKKHLGDLRMVAENLGDITPEVEQLRRELDLPGMAVLQFAFSGADPDNAFLPHNFERNVFAYTGTHDNDTLMGWWNSTGGDSTRSDEDIRKEKSFALQYVGDGTEAFQWRLLRALYSSIAQAAIVPMQDVLGLPSASRMNRPGDGEGNWTWRLPLGAFSPGIQAHLKELAVVYGRAPRNH